MRLVVVAAVAALGLAQQDRVLVSRVHPPH